ncbi:MAG: hypothetical protein JXA54_13910 [Candidatus Heimdallarchaeota archaeon]|nr:hypothetical protein [Candidatus Heimdallarchaeota archaeon]
MDLNEFNQNLILREISEREIEIALYVAEKFNVFLEKKNKSIFEANTTDVIDFSIDLIKQNLNTYENFIGLIRYTFFVKNKEAYVSLCELIDGSKVPENLSIELAKIMGEKKRDEILKGIYFPELGTSAEIKPKITKQMIERLKHTLNEETQDMILKSDLHGIPREAYLRQKEEFLNSKNIDEYLVNRRAVFIQLMEKHRDEGTLFYTQEVDDSVVEYVLNDPMVEGGVRKGNIIYTTKIPYMTKQFLKEINDDLRNYYYCHCSWVREALKKGDIKVPSEFCKCSAGYYKKRWDVILDQPVNVEVVETILDGAPRCLFAIHVPEDVVANAEK